MARTKEEWDSIIANERKLIEQFGPAIAAVVLGLELKQVKHAAYSRGVYMLDRSCTRMSAVDKAVRVQQAKEWRAAGCKGNAPKRIITHKDTGKFNRSLKICAPEGVAPNVTIFDEQFRSGASIDMSRAKVTIAPKFVDMRFAPSVDDPEYRAVFSACKIGTDPMTGKAWA